MTKEELLNNVKQTVLAFDKNATVILFGSRARGDYNDLSDWDFLLLFNHDVDSHLMRKVRDKLFETELESDQVFSSVIHSRFQWEAMKITPFYKNVIKEGIRL